MMSSLPMMMAMVFGGHTYAYYNWITACDVN